MYEKSRFIADVKDCPIEDVENIIKKQQKFFITRLTFVYFGLCPRCQ